MKSLVILLGKIISWPAISICHGSKIDFKYYFMSTLMLNCFKSKMFIRKKDE